ncbi:flagellar brake protein [Nitrosomonas supralitoralis]|uniref:Flagellar brake protein YcgR n=1 Tax=Nitrosomonas supralitoralis TaxID=2116706 RepID=A0A2P7NY69_9PROT|nr:flagellar brake protein [Nitrosomonas supralitoralis]PSJ18387.1 flagellar brake protein [Nitrosomonas supralitoralis]
MLASDKNTETYEVLEPTKLSPEEKSEKFRINSEIDILFILRGIMQADSLITLYPDYESDFILTSILAINSDKKEMLIDYGINDKHCQKALHSKELVFVTTQNRVKIEFVCDQIKKIQFNNKDAFLVNIPKMLLRIQRRNHFRITTPIVKPLKCVIPIPGKNAANHKAEVALLDISCGGTAVIDQHPIINFDPGIIYNNCQISLPEIGIITVNIQVKNTYEITLRNGQNCMRAGCQFINLAAGMEAMIQRYIIKQEQNRKMK